MTSTPQSLYSSFSKLEISLRTALNTKKAIISIATIQIFVQLIEDDFELSSRHDR